MNYEDYEIEEYHAKKECYQRELVESSVILLVALLAVAAVLSVAGYVYHICQ